MDTFDSPKAFQKSEQSEDSLDPMKMQTDMSKILLSFKMKKLAKPAKQPEQKKSQQLHKKRQSAQVDLMKHRISQRITKEIYKNLEDLQPIRKFIDFDAQ